jgi:hypothetical protein
MLTVLYFTVATFLTLAKRDRKQMNIFEMKVPVYRRILGPVDNEIENWRILTNKEIYAVVKKPP